jgi:hypothetical protein
MGAFTSTTAGKLWYQTPAIVRQAFDPNLMVTVDLGLCPSKVTPQQVVVDDYDDKLYIRSTTVGGAASAGWGGWPEGKSTGVVYLSEAFRTANNMPAVPPDGSGAPYEFQSAWYWPGTNLPQASMRFLGFHAQILQSATRPENGVQVTRSLVAVYRAGTSQASTPTVEKVLNWVNLADLTMFDAHVSQNGLTAIGTAPGQPQIGALWINRDYAKVHPFDDPKRPANLGE